MRPPGLAEQPWAPSHSSLLAQGVGRGCSGDYSGFAPQHCQETSMPCDMEDVPERARVSAAVRHRSMAGSRASAPLSAAPILESRGGNAIAAGLLAAIQ